MFQYFYNETLRKLTLAFGGLFDEIYISKNMSNGQPQKTRVPLSYAGKEKFIRRIEEASSISNNVKLETMLPRLAFEMLSLQYDPSRKINKINKKFRSSGTGENTVYYQGYTEVPYNVRFDVHCFTRNVDDNLQVIEQIIPYFSPEFIVTLKMNNLDVDVDVPVVLTSTNFAGSSEGDFLTRRAVISTMSFNAKAYVFGRILESGSGIIKEVDINILEDDTL